MNEKTSKNAQKTAIVIGAGPAGLMAAEHLAAAGLNVTIYERMASPARKLLMAGRGGLNLTHSEDFPKFPRPLWRGGGKAETLRSTLLGRKLCATGAPALNRKHLSEPAAAFSRGR